MCGGGSFGVVEIDGDSCIREKVTCCCDDIANGDGNVDAPRFSAAAMFGSIGEKAVGVVPNEPEWACGSPA